MRPTAKSLVLDLLSTARGGTMPVRALVSAAELFGIAENGIRVELARLSARGLVQRNERGHYVLAKAAAPVHGRVSGWKDLEAAHVPWSGGWIGVHAAGLSRRDRRALRRRERALRFLGLRELHAGLWVRPDNLRGGIADAALALRALGLEASAPIFVMHDLEPELEKRARRLWNSEALCKGYRELRTALEASERRLTALPPARALVETFSLGGRAIRALALDPLLPEPLVPAGERRALVDAMQRYDRAGRRVWAKFMPTHGAADQTSPADLRLVRGAAPLVEQRSVG